MLIPGKNQGKRDQVKNFPTRGWGGHLFPQENSNIIRGGRRLGKDSHIKGELPKVVLADDSHCQIRVLQRGSSESGLSLGGSLHNLLIFDSMVIVMVKLLISSRALWNSVLTSAAMKRASLGCAQFVQE